MAKKFKFPTIAAVTEELRLIKKNKRSKELEVRLQVEADGDWSVWSGDVAAATDQDYWSDSHTLSGRSSCEKLAKKMLSEAKDHYHQSQPDDETAKVVEVQPELKDWSEKPVVHEEAEQSSDPIHTPTQDSVTPASSEREFSVIEYSSHFAVRHNPTGEEQPMGDGVDLDFGDDSADPVHYERIRVGHPEFRQRWEEWLNQDQEVTMNAYFPHLYGEQSNE